MSLEEALLNTQKLAIRRQPSHPDDKEPVPSKFTNSEILDKLRLELAEQVIKNK